MNMCINLLTHNMVYEMTKTTSELSVCQVYQVEDDHCPNIKFNVVYIAQLITHGCTLEFHAIIPSETEVQLSMTDLNQVKCIN